MTAFFRPKVGHSFDVGAGVVNHRKSFTGEAPVAFGQGGFLALARWVVEMQKLERQNQERLAAVYLDPIARQLLNVLNRKTSIKWEDLPDVVEGESPDILRSVVLLAGANLCDASPSRLRLSEYGDELLAESSVAEQANSEPSQRKNHTVLDCGAGSVVFHGSVAEPLMPAEDWEMLEEDGT